MPRTVRRKPKRMNRRRRTRLKPSWDPPRIKKPDQSKLAHLGMLDTARKSSQVGRRLPRRQGLRRRVAELSVACYEIVAVRGFESDQDGQILPISEPVSRTAHLFHGWILDGRHAAIQQGDEASLFHLRESELGPGEDFHHLPVDMPIGDQVARTVARDLEEEAFIACEQEATDQCVRSNQQLHDTASSRIPSSLREGSVPIARG